jgi:hypothetical protein
VPEVSPADREEGERIAAAITDPGLRDLVARAAAAALADRSADPPGRSF